MKDNLAPGSVLPELMRFADGRPVTTADEWAERRKEILALFETYMYGKMPDAGRERVAYRIVSGGTAREREMQILAFQTDARQRVRKKKDGRKKRH